MGKKMDGQKDGRDPLRLSGIKSPVTSAGSPIARESQQMAQTRHLTSPDGYHRMTRLCGLF